MAVLGEASDEHESSILQRLRVHAVEEELEWAQRRGTTTTAASMWQLLGARVEGSSSS